MIELPSLKYGPVGDPTSDDPFERAQAQAPKGWHVEGQKWGGRMDASGPNAEGMRVWATTERGPEGLIEEMKAKAASR